MKNVQLAWTNPSTRVDNSGLPESEIGFIEVERSLDGGASFTAIAQLPPSAQGFLVENLNPGTHLFGVVVVDNQVPPQRSVVATVTVEVPDIKAEPSPVTNLTATVVDPV